MAMTVAYFFSLAVTLICGYTASAYVRLRTFYKVATAAWFLSLVVSFGFVLLALGIASGTILGDPDIALRGEITITGEAIATTGALLLAVLIRTKKVTYRNF